MFIAIALITIGFVAIVAYRDWVTYHRLGPKERQRLLVEISALISREEWQEAKEKLFPLTTLTPLPKEVRLLHIEVLRGTQHHEEALQRALEASALEPEELLYRVEEGKTWLERGEAQKALEAFAIAEPILRRESDLLDYATACLRAGFPERCWEILEPLLASFPRGKTFALAGDTLLAQKEFQGALDHYSRCMEMGWNTHQVQTQRGHAHRYLGEFARAEQIYRKILEKDSGDVAATLGLGACMEERGHFQRALLLYESARAWEKQDPEMIVRAASCALSLQRYEVAEAYYGELVKHHTPSPDIFLAYGQVLEIQHKWGPAEQLYKHFLHLFPEDFRGYLALAWLFGVGLSTTLSDEEGLDAAHTALHFRQDALSLEILSACEARIGRFESAYQIQEYLATLDREKPEKVRRGHLLKRLRQEIPLDGGQITKQMVA